MPNPVVHFEIQSNKHEEIQKFYGDLFGWHIEQTPMDYGIVDTHTENGIGGGIGGTNGGPNRVTFYVESEDIHGSLKKANELGGKTVMDVMDIPGMVTMALFEDPEGNVVGIVSNQTPSAEG